MQNRLRHSGLGMGSALTAASTSRSWTQRYISDLLAVPVSDSRMDLTWVNNGNVDWTGTKIYVSIDNGVNFTLHDTITSVGTTYSATGLTAGQFYVFYTVPYKGSSQGAASNMAYGYPLFAETTTYINGLATPLSDFQKNSINHFYGDVLSWLDLENISDDFDLLTVYAGETEESSLKNTSKNAHHSAKVNSPVFTAFEGYLPVVASSSYLKTNYQALSQGQRYTQNDAGMGVYLRSQITNEIKVPIGAAKTAGGNAFSQIIPKYQLDNNVVINTDTAVKVKNYTFDAGMYAGFRDSATNLRGYINNIKKIDVTDNTSNEPNDLEVFVGTRNLDGTPNAVADWQVAIAFISKSLTENKYRLFLRACDAYMRRNGKSVLSYLDTQVDKSITPVTVFTHSSTLSEIQNYFFRGPHFVYTDNGVLICACAGLIGGAADGRMNDMVIRRSNDKGNTWGTPSVLLYNNGVYTTPSHGSRVYGSSLLHNAGRTYLFVTYIDDETYTNIWGAVLDPELWQTSFGYIYSDDDGVTWSAFNDLNALIPASTNLFLAGQGEGIKLTNGTLVVPFHAYRESANTDDAGEDWGVRSGILYSTNNGATWQISSMIPSFTDECSICEYEPNKVAILCVTNTIYYRVYTTDDLGSTWATHANDRKIEGGPTAATIYKYNHSGVTKFLMSKDFGTLRMDVRLRISDDFIVWKDACQLQEAASLGYTSIAGNNAGDLCVGLETGYDMVVFNMSPFKDDLIKGSSALPYGVIYPSPVIVSATVENAAKDRIVLTFDKLMDDASVPATSSFSPSGGKSVLSVSINRTAKTCTVVLDSAYIFGDVITLSYTAPETNKLKGYLSGSVANLVNQAVTNNIADDYPVTGLVGRWKMDGNANDSSGNDLHLTNNNGSLTSDKNGAANKAYDLVPASSAWLTRDDFTEAKITAEFTVSIWFKFDTLANLDLLIGHLDLATYAYGWAITWATGDKLKLWVGNHSTPKAEVSFNDTAGWHHAIASYKRTGTDYQQIQLQIDNGDVAYGRYFDLVNYTNCVFSLGKKFGPAYTDVKVDEVAIWNRELTAGEKTIVYNKGV